MFLPIIVSRELVDTRLATYGTRLVYLQKITEHNEPFMLALMTASNLRHPLFEWSVSLLRIFDMRNAHVLHMVTSQLMTCSS
jgi:hypothetical protein